MNTGEINPKEIGRRIRAARMAKGLSQVELAKLMGNVNSSTLCAYELGRLSPPLRTIAKIANLLERTVDFFIFGEETTEYERQCKEKKAIESLRALLLNEGK